MTEPTDPTTAADVDPQTAADAAERLDDAALREWLDNRHAEVERDHRDGWTGRTCYCDVPKPCADRAYELAAIDTMRALLTDRARLAAEREQVRKDHRRQLGSAVFWRRRAFQLADLIPAEQIPDPEWDDSDESQLAERNEELRNAVTEAARLLNRLAAPDPCEIDSDGSCWAHEGRMGGYLEPCPHPAGRRFAEAWGAGQGDATAGMAASTVPDGAGDTQAAEQCANGLRDLTKLEGPQRGSQGDAVLCLAGIPQDIADRAGLSRDALCHLHAGHTDPTHDDGNGLSWQGPPFPPDTPRVCCTPSRPCSCWDCPL